MGISHCLVFQKVCWRMLFIILHNCYIRGISITNKEIVAIPSLDRSLGIHHLGTRFMAHFIPLQMVQVWVAQLKKEPTMMNELVTLNFFMFFWWLAKRECMYVCILFRSLKHKLDYVMSCTLHWCESGCYVQRFLSGRATYSYF